MNQLETLGCHFGKENSDASEIATGPAEARDETSDRVNTGHESLLSG
jgi:hypothetical protein